MHLYEFQITDRYIITVFSNIPYIVQLFYFERYDQSSAVALKPYNL